MSDASLVPDGVLKWLHSNLRSNYSNFDRTFHDIAQALSAYRSLSPRTEVYTSEYGTSDLLLLLQGVLPISFRGGIYQFPLGLWIPKTYPYEPPIVYMTPTPELAVRPGPHVSVEGRVYHPYIAQWAQQESTSTIVKLLGILRQTFATNPPLVTRQQIPLKPAKLPSTDADANGLQRQPDARPRYETTNAEPGAHSVPRVPDRPPKPPEIRSHSTMLNLAQRSIAGQSPGHSITSNRRAHSPQLQLQHAMHPGGVTSDVKMNGSSSSGTAGRPRNVLEVHHGRRIELHDGLSKSNTPHHDPVSPWSNTSISPGHNRQYNPSANAHLHHQTALSTSGRGITGREASMRLQVQQRPVADLLSLPMEVEISTATSSKGPAVAPPIPRNPERGHLLSEIAMEIASQLDQTLSNSSTTIPALDAQERALLTAQHHIQRESTDLNALTDQVKSNERILHHSIQEANQLVDSVGSKNAPSVDDMLVAPTVVGEQLYNLVAEERSIADAMFVLTRALDRSRLQGDVFVKQYRGLSREQFLQKALIKKIATRMGLLSGIC